MRTFFKAYKHSEKVRFTCTICNQKNRQKTFTTEHTASPYNRNGNGSVKTPEEVIKGGIEAAKKLVCDFMQEPICNVCWNNMHSDEKRQWHLRRKETDNEVA